MKLLVKAGRVIDPANGLDEVADVLVADGVVAAVGRDLAAGEAQVLDASGKVVCPGFIDLHVHLREPGLEYKEDIRTGTRAAALGGFTTVCCMPNTRPVVDNFALASFVRRRSEETGLVRVHPIGAITKQQQGKEMAEMGGMVAAGCTAFSDDGRPVMNAEVMRRAMEYARMLGATIISHCEDLDLTGDGQMHEGFFSTLYGLKGIPALAEEVMVARDLQLAEATGARLHIAHVSTAGAVELVRQAKARGVQVTCEATPHHLVLTDECLGTYDTDFKVNPPLRSAADVQALREGLRDGTIDCIATDHAPHEVEAKDCEFNLASAGISGLETAVAVLHHHLVAPGQVELRDLVACLTVKPARALRLQGGALTPGQPADITVLDLEETRRVEPGGFESKGRNTPFKGMLLTGWPWATVCGGRLVALAGRVVE